MLSDVNIVRNHISIFLHKEHWQTVDAFYYQEKKRQGIFPVTLRAFQHVHVQSTIPANQLTLVAIR